MNNQTPYNANFKYQKAAAFLIIVSATLLIFPFVFQGFYITNNFYLYAYEPWAHHMAPNLGFYNYMLSDDMDVMSVGFPANEYLRRGELPLWNQYWQLGFNGFRIDSGWFYPLRWLWIIFDIELGMTLEVLIRHALGAFFTFLALQMLGVSWIVGLVVAIGYAFGSTAIGDYMYGFGPISLALPVMFYLIERLIQRRKTIDLLLTTFGWILINSHIMIHLNALCSIWLFLYALGRIFYENDRAYLLKRLLITAISAALIFSFAILPTLDFYLSYFNESYRADYSTQQIHPGSLLTLFYNSFFGIPLLERDRYFFGSYTGSAIFLGFLTGLGALGLSIVRLVLARDRFIVPVALLAILSLFTTYQFPFERLEFFFVYIPILKHTPPYYQRPIFQFILMVAGALGLDFLIRNFSKQSIRALSLVIMLVITALSFSSYIINYHSVGPSDLSLDYYYSSTLLHFLLLFSFITYCYFSIFNKAPLFRAAIITVSGMLLIGATTYEARLNCSNWTPYSKSGNWNPPTETTDFLRRVLQPGERVITLDKFAVPGLLFGYGIPVAAGRALPQKEYLELLRLAAPELYKDHPTQSFFNFKETDLRSAVWDLANVNYFLASVEVDRTFITERYGGNLKIHNFNDGVILEKAIKSNPYILTDKVHKVDSMNHALEALEENGTQIGLISYDQEFDSNREKGSCQNSAEVRDLIIAAASFKANIVIKGVGSDCPTYFMPSFAYDKGWKAYVNGEEAQIYTAYGLFPFIQIQEPGEHKIEFIFIPRYLGLGLLLSLFGLTLLIWKVKVEHHDNVHPKA